MIAIMQISMFLLKDDLHENLKRGLGLRKIRGEYTDIDTYEGEYFDIDEGISCRAILQVLSSVLLNNPRLGRLYITQSKLHICFSTCYLDRELKTIYLTPDHTPEEIRTVVHSALREVYGSIRPHSI